MILILEIFHISAISYGMVINQQSKFKHLLTSQQVGIYLGLAIGLIAGFFAGGVATSYLGFGDIRFWEANRGCGEKDDFVEDLESELKIIGSAESDAVESDPAKAVDAESDDHSSIASEEICVDVAGAVMAPGVYCLDKDSMVINALLKAGDINYKAYAFQYVSKYINYARKIRPNEKIYIPFAEEYSCTAKKFQFAEDIPKDDDLVSTIYIDGSGREISSTGEVISSVADRSDSNSSSNDGETDQGISCININSASIDELDSLPGIGQSTAQKIIDARPFSSVEGLLDVSGIGDSKYESIKDLVCI